MFKTMFTLIRGAAARAEEEVADRSALMILDQQIRDAAAAIERSKRALALAIAQDEAEGKRLDTTLKRIADLEERGVAALAGGREDLAAEAAEAIAVMEADRDAIGEARRVFSAEIGQLKATVASAGRRLSELERGRRIALAAESVRRLKAGPAAAGPSRPRVASPRRRPPSSACGRSRRRTRRRLPPTRRLIPGSIRPAPPAGSKPPASVGGHAPPRPMCWRACARPWRPRTAQLQRPPHEAIPIKRPIPQQPNPRRKCNVRTEHPE